MGTWSNWEPYEGPEYDEYYGDDLTLDYKTAQQVHTYLYKTFGLVQKRDIKPLKITDDWLDILAQIERL